MAVLLAQCTSTCPLIDKVQGKDPIVLHLVHQQVISPQQNTGVFLHMPIHQLRNLLACLFMDVFKYKPEEVNGFVEDLCSGAQNNGVNEPISTRGSPAYDTAAKSINLCKL